MSTLKTTRATPLFKKWIFQIDLMINIEASFDLCALIFLLIYTVLFQDSTEPSTGLQCHLLYPPGLSFDRSDCFYQR